LLLLWFLALLLLLCPRCRRNLNPLNAARGAGTRRSLPLAANGSSSLGGLAVRPAARSLPLPLPLLAAAVVRPTA
jgi:hypothetical protein